MLSDQLERLLEQWHEANARGLELTAEDLCPGDPTLAGKLAYHIGVLRQMKQLVSGLGEPIKMIQLWKK